MGYKFWVRQGDSPMRNTVIRLAGIASIVASSFAAGADIKEMAELTYPQIYLDDLFSDSDRVANQAADIAACCGCSSSSGLLTRSRPSASPHAA